MLFNNLMKIKEFNIFDYRRFDMKDFMKWYTRYVFVRDGYFYIRFF